MNSNFFLLNKCYQTIDYYNKILINYPKTEVLLKQSIEKTYYEMIENLFSFNINSSDRIKQKYLKDFLVKVSMLDFYTRISNSKKVISKRQYEVIGNRITELRKMAYGLVKNETNED